MLCCDEKSQCQALERSQPGSVVRGHSRTQTHDYRRHGTVTLFAALSYLLRPDRSPAHPPGVARVPPPPQPRNARRGVPAPDRRQLRHAMKSWATWHNRRHRKAHGVDRIALHFTPTSSSWMNLVERFFRDLTVDVVRDGSCQRRRAGRGHQRLPCRAQPRPQALRWRKSGDPSRCSVLGEAYSQCASREAFSDDWA